MSEFIFSGIRYQVEILVSYAIQPLAVDAGLYGCNHPLEQSCGTHILAYLGRPFVNAQEVTHSVARSVTEIQFFPPQRHSRSSIHPASRSSGREE